MARNQLFVPSVLDDYGFDPYEWRLLCRISRRGKCTESLASIARSCGMGRTRASEAKKVLEAAGCIKVDGGQGAKLTMQLLPFAVWQDDIAGIRKRIKEGKTCSPREQVEHQDKAGEDAQPVRQANTSSPPGEHPTSLKGNHLKGGNTAVSEAVRDQIMSEFDGELVEGAPDFLDNGKRKKESANPNARSLYELWKQSFPGVRITAEDSLPLTTASILYANPTHKKAYELALEKWRYGVNTAGWNPANFAGILDKTHKILEHHVPVRKQARQAKPTSEPNVKQDLKGQREKQRQEWAFNYFQQLPAEEMQEIERAAEIRATKLCEFMQDEELKHRMWPGTVQLEIADIVLTKYDNERNRHHDQES